MRQIIFCLALATAIAAGAQNPPAPAAKSFSPAPTNLIPPVPHLSSPVSFFRQLLAMTPGERNLSLSNRPPESRKIILAKVREYLALGPDERELRLQATDLRWHLTPLMRLPATERAAKLAQVPEDLRELVNSRLAQWDLLPPALQQELLANDKALHYFARVETTNQTTITAEQKNISEQFNQFFELTAAEKQQALTTLSGTERAQMEKTLQTFEKLPTRQRLTCVRNYAKFAGMSGAERAEFLQSADSWSKLSPKERQTWRDLVAHIPQWPPLPPVTVSPNLMPPVAPRISRPNIATNLN